MKIKSISNRGKNIRKKFLTSLIVCSIGMYAAINTGIVKAAGGPKKPESSSLSDVAKKRYLEGFEGLVKAAKNAEMEFRDIEDIDVYQRNSSSIAGKVVKYCIEGIRKSSRKKVNRSDLENIVSKILDASNIKNLREVASNISGIINGVKIKEITEEDGYKKVLDLVDSLIAAMMEKVVEGLEKLYIDEDNVRSEDIKGNIGLLASLSKVFGDINKKLRR